MHTGRDVEGQKSINTLSCDCDLFALKFSTKYLLADSSTATYVDSFNPANEFGPIPESAVQSQLRQDTTREIKWDGYNQGDIALLYIIVMMTTLVIGLLF